MSTVYQHIRHYPKTSLFRLITAFNRPHRKLNILPDTCPFTDRRKEFKEKKTLGYTPEQIYNVVADINNYKAFLPWCKESEILKERPDHCIAKLTVGFPPLGDSYTSVVYRQPFKSVRSIATNGHLFKHMETVWKFEPGPITSSTIVNISTIFEFRSLIYASLGLPIFDEVAKTLAASFESRCRHLYGPDAFRTTNKYNIHQTPTPS